MTHEHHHAPEVQDAKAPEQKKRRPAHITTAQGSRYTYLDDGRTQRFKTVEGKEYDPQDVLVFIPPWEAIHAQAKQIYPHIFGDIKNDVEYEALLNGYAFNHGFTMKVVDGNQKEIKTNAEAEAAERLFVACLDNNDPLRSFLLPVTHEPKVNYFTFDTTKFNDKDGNLKRSRHMGTPVTQIRYTDE